MEQKLVTATVITGFLGAGKTTLIRNIIEQADGKRLALIVNEFGDVGIDGMMLDECSAPSCRTDDIIELANGCICCTVADDFLPSMQSLLNQSPPLTISLSKHQAWHCRNHWFKPFNGQILKPDADLMAW